MFSDLLLRRVLRGCLASKYEGLSFQLLRLHWVSLGDSEVFPEVRLIGRLVHGFVDRAPSHLGVVMLEAAASWQLGMTDGGSKGCH